MWKVLQCCVPFKNQSIASHLTFKASYVAECIRILMDMVICKVTKICSFSLRLCVSAAFLHLHWFLVWLTYKRKYQQKRAHTHTHTQVYWMLQSRVPHCWLVAKVTPHCRVRKQTAHNIIGNYTTCQHCMTCPVTLETSISSTSAAPLSSPLKGWRDVTGDCFLIKSDEMKRIKEKVCYFWNYIIIFIGIFWWFKIIIALKTEKCESLYSFQPNI